MSSRADVAAELHDHLCVHWFHGYTQGGGRWGDGEGVCAITVDGRTYNVEQGDRDCSSSVVECWSCALEGTPYEGALSGATYTGDMRGVFAGSGLFAWRPMGDGYVAQRGDIYLNEVKHTAMCQSATPDKLSEFSVDENGGIIGGVVGDQTGRESAIRNYYNYPWDGILAYNGRADNNNYDDSEATMQCIIRPNGMSLLCYFDGTQIRALAHPDEVSALDMAYRACHGRGIPVVAIGYPDSPWASRLLQAVGGDEAMAGFASF